MRYGAAFRSKASRWCLFTFGCCRTLGADIPGFTLFHFRFVILHVAGVSWKTKPAVACINPAFVRIKFTWWACRQLDSAFNTIPKGGANHA